MSLMTGININTFVQYGGGAYTGTATVTQINSAMQVAWEMAEDFIGTFLYPTTVTDEVHPWPANNMLQLSNHHVTQVNTVTAKHDSETCDCDTVDYTGCSILWDKELGSITVRDCYSATPCCNTCRCSETGYGTWVYVDYVAGLSHPLDAQLIMALMLISMDVLEAILSNTANIAALAILTAWKSMDYSENIGATNQSNPFQFQKRSELVYNILVGYRLKRALMAFGNPRFARIL